MFEPLAHSFFSFLRASCSPEELFIQASKIGVKSLGLCDFGGFYGLPEAYRASLKYGVTLFPGVELCLENHELTSCIKSLIFLAHTQRGYEVLGEMITRAQMPGEFGGVSVGPKGQHLISWEMVHKYCGGLKDVSVIVPPRPRVWGVDKHFEDAFFQLQNFPSSFFAMTDDGTVNMRKYSQKVLKNIATERVLITADVFHSTRLKKQKIDLIGAIRRNSVVGKILPEWMNDQHFLQDLRHLARDRFGVSYEYFANEKLESTGGFSLGKIKYEYPKEIVPEGMESQQYIESLVYGAYEKLESLGKEKLLPQIKQELGLISELRYADYFLTVWDVVCWARNQNILCQGRGSAANSVVCYLLGITSVDPVRMDLLFERFLSRERSEPPDIDVDFEHQRREEVMQYVYRRYGRDRAAMVCNVIRYRTRGAIRAVGKALGVSPLTIDKIGDVTGRGGLAFSDSLEAHSIPEDLGNLWQTLVDDLYMTPRHLGIHSGGFVVSEKPIFHSVPIENATMENRTVIQWDKTDLEDMGLFKVDLLALGMLSTIRRCFDFLKDRKGAPLRMNDVPAEDFETYQMIQAADTVGTFQIESRAQISILGRLLPKSFYDLVISIAIVRPGPIKGGTASRYIRRRSGEEPIIYEHPALEKILSRTLGVPIFQEQVMKIVMAVAGFSAGEADELRRCVGTWKKSGDLQKFRQKILLGMKESGLSVEFSESLCDMIEGFAEYGFPESHAASFALITYVSCYIKCHYPDVFLAGLLNSQPLGFYSPHTLIEDAKRHRVHVLPVCARESFWEASLPRDNHVRLGFGLVHGLSKSGVEKMIAWRIGQKETLIDWLREIPLNRRDRLALALANAFEFLNISRREALWLFELDISPLEDVPEIQAPGKKEEDVEHVNMDFQATGTSLYAHPVKIYREQLFDFDHVDVSRITLAENLKKKPTGSRVTMLGLVIVRQMPPAAHGMVFFTLEDETGLINLVIDPKTYDQYRMPLYQNSLICVEGELQRQESSLSIKISKVFSQKARLAFIQESIQDRIPTLGGLARNFI